MTTNTYPENRLPPGPLSNNYDYNGGQTISMEFGFILILTGLLGIVWPNFLSLNLSPAHSLVLCASGAASVWSAVTTNKRHTFLIQLGLGIFFLLHVIVGWAVGDPAEPARFNFYSPDQLERLAPGFLELSTVDHIVHGLLSVVFFSEALVWRQYLKGKDIDIRNINLRKKSISRVLKIGALALIATTIFFVVDQIQRSLPFLNQH